MGHIVNAIYFFLISITFSVSGNNILPQKLLDEGNPCQLPGNQTGICTLVEKCQSLLTDLKDKKTTTNQIEICSFVGSTSQTIVCCPIEGTEIFETTSLRIDTSSSTDKTESTFSNSTSEQEHTVTDTSDIAPPTERTAPKNRYDSSDVISQVSNLILNHERRPVHLHGIKFLSPNNPVNTIANVCADYLLASATNHWKDELVDNIIGGTSVYDETIFPHMAALAYNPELIRDSGRYDFLCAGIIISEKYILTAAHCTYISRRAPVRIRVGTVNATANREELFYDIAQIIPHPKYDATTSMNDIALIQLNSSLKFSSRVQPACLWPYPEQKMKNGTQLTIAGWGLTNLEKETESKILQKATLNFIELSTCNDTLYKYAKSTQDPKLLNGLSDGQLCAYDPENMQDTCRGDSGGPIQIPNGHPVAMVVGITSFGAECGTVYPGVYARTAHYNQWITDIVWPYISIKIA